MVTALVSALTGKKVKGNVAMTGEVTLTGQVLPIGGLKEKSLAAYRYGIDTIIIPKENEKDIEKIPDSIKNNIKICEYYFVQPPTIIENNIIRRRTWVNLKKKKQMMIIRMVLSRKMLFR